LFITSHGPALTRPNQPPTTRRRTASLVATAALALAPLAAVAPAHSAVDGKQVVISEVYGGGGNTGATYKQDFVELYNPTTAPVSLSSMSVQYRSGSGTTDPSSVVPLTGTIPAGGHYLVGLGKGTGGTTDLPTPDDSGSTAMSATAGTVFLADQTTALSAPPVGSVTGDPRIVDLVGFGTSNTFETTATAAPANPTSVARAANGADSDVNAADLSVGAPSPANTGTVTPPPPPPPGDPEPHSIAEIQGTTDTSPLAGRTVVTDGVVTASYPTGGFKGFYVQTAGTGGDLPAGHDASDAVFVFLGSATDYPAIGDHVRVTAPVSEFNGLTELSPAAGGVTRLADSVPSPAPVTDAYPGTDAGREAEEGMLQAPSGDFTVTDVYTLNNYGEINLASGTTPLRQPTDVARPGTPAAQAVADDNAARGVTLDDGSSTNYLTTGKDTPLPWLTPESPIRVGAPAQFSKPVVLDFRNSVWKLQPTSQLTADNAAGVQPATFPNTRTAAPAHVDGDLKLASFNVLNYFTETGEDYVAAGNTCSSYNDRAGNPITVNDCGPVGPRGAWDDASLQRQQAKTVHAINTLGADVLSLEEIENSAKYRGPENRDEALSTLVEALNADAGSPVWAFVPSPAPADQPPLAEQDVIRTAFIYKQAAAEPVGPSYILTGSTAFGNARQPLAQVFKTKGGVAAQEFLAVVNHFKSKGSGSGPDADQGDGQGASNHSRTLQAQALVDFVAGLKTRTGVSRVFLTGDFNSYTQEDPMQVLYDNGYTDIGSSDTDESTYVFDGLVGSLDHVLGNAEAMGTVQDAHVWNINSVESVAYEYSRYNYNATDFYADGPFRSSDHDPLLVGFTLPTPVPPKVSQTLATIAPKRPEAGRAAVVDAQVTTGDGQVVDDGRVEVREGGTLLGQGEVSRGAVMIPVRFLEPGRHTITVSYLGNDAVAPSATTLTVDVTKPKKH
jgi:predicted extracellular nuclease